MLVFERANQVDALLDGAHRCDLMVDFHWLHSVSFVRVHACVIHDWFVEVFSLVSKDSIIGSALHDAEVVGPL